MVVRASSVTQVSDKSLVTARGELKFFSLGLGKVELCFHDATSSGDQVVSSKVHDISESALYVFDYTFDTSAVYFSSMGPESVDAAPEHSPYFSIF